MNLPFLISVEPVSCFQRQDPVFLFIFTTVGMEKLKSLLWWQETSCAHRASRRARQAPCAPFLYGKSFTSLKQTVVSAGSRYKKYLILCWCFLFVCLQRILSFVCITNIPGLAMKLYSSVWGSEIFLQGQVDSKWFMETRAAELQTVGWGGRDRQHLCFRKVRKFLDFHLLRLKNEEGNLKGRVGEMKQMRKEPFLCQVGCALPTLLYLFTPHTVQCGKSPTLLALTSFTFFPPVKAHFLWQVLKC